MNEKKLQEFIEWYKSGRDELEFSDMVFGKFKDAVPFLIAEVERLRKIVLDVADLTSPKNINSWRFNDPEGCLCAVSDLVEAEAAK